MWLPVWTPFRAVDRSAVVWVRILNVVAVVTMLVINGLAASGNINGTTPGAVSDRYYTFLTPAGYAFSIWGLIYFAIASWMIYQLLPRTYEDAVHNEAIGYLAIVSALLNVGWIFAWHFYQMWLALILMFALLAVLSTIYYRLSKFDPPETYAEWLLTVFPFGIYLAWIIGAAIINLYSATTNTFTTEFVAPAVVGLLLAGIVQSYVSILRLDPTFTAVGCWAIAAIAVNFAPGGSGRVQNATVSVAASTVSAFLGVEALVVLLCRFKFIAGLARAERQGESQGIQV